MKNIFKSKKTLVAVLATLGIILTTLGITVAWFSYSGNGTRENSISSGSITFIYEENEDVGNGILLEDAMPMPDSYGKAQNDWFDFKVKSSSGKANIPYEITLRKTAGSDDIGDSVKVYLTKVNGSNEEEKVLSIYNSLANSTNEIASINNEKTLYKSSIPAEAKNYTDNYRLRIWLNDNPSDGNVLSYQQTITQECSDSNYDNKTDCEANHANWLDVAQPATAKNFTVKVNVYANGEAATQEELADANSTGIQNIEINGLEATENEDPNASYDYSLTTTNGSITINVDTSNTNATADITEYDPENPTAMNSHIRRLSTSKTFNVTNGDNYFKVTITSANKQKIKEYILKVVKEISHNADLASLTFDGCTLNETFSSSKLTYTCNTTSPSLAFTGSAVDSGTTIEVTENDGISECGTAVKIKTIAEDGTTTKTFTVTATFTGTFSYTDVSGDSILSILKDNDLSDGYYNFKINGKTDEYKVHLYTFNGDQTWTTDHKFGTAADVGGSCGMAKHMVAVKVNGDLTNSAKIEPYYTNYGGPKGFTLYVTGTLTNTGTIDNSHGAYAQGDDVYVWKNANGTYEYIPALGGAGGARQTNWDSNGNDGLSGSNNNILATTVVKRATGGGGSGSAHHTYNGSGAGGQGTSYSGGAGGGSAKDTSPAGNGSSIGGPGGTRACFFNDSYGGVGNPGSNGAPSGTGGLLIIYANEYNNNGTISARGTDTLNANMSGGASGGGSINVFYNTLVNNKTMSATGGNSTYSAERGGVGGAGTANAGSIATGTYVAN